MVDTKIIERIRALLAMAADTSSPNEAAIAAKRAAALMRQHNIDSADAILTDLKQDENIVKQNVRGNIWRTKARSIASWSQTMAVMVGQLYDCHCVQTQSVQFGWVIQYWGYKTDVEAAVWTYTYLLQQVARFQERFIKAEPLSDRARRMSYLDGVTDGLRVNLIEAKQDKEREAKGSSMSTALVVAKQAAIEKAFGEVGYASKKKGRQTKDWDAKAHGYRDGRSVNVNPKVLEHDAPAGSAKLEDNGVAP